MSKTQGGKSRFNRSQRLEKNTIEANWDTEINSFDEMELSDDLLHGIYGYGFEHPSKIQSLAIHPIRSGRNIIAQAQSGTGKTGAFSIGILSRINLNDYVPQAMVLAPTHELAEQIYEVFKGIAKFLKGFSSEIFIGKKTTIQEDEEKMRYNPKIIVGCPGRISHLIQKGSLRVDKMLAVCLDEADEMLRENFSAEIKEIFSYLQKGIQVLLFSATFPPEIVKLTEQFLSDPIKIFVKEENLTLEGISQFYVNVGESQYKLDTLIDLYSQMNVQKAVVFANKKETVTKLKEQLDQRDFTVLSIHGAMEQKDRSDIMKQFRVGAARILISTDLIGRGIDVQQITLVINYELPIMKESYIHRIGRSGRYGKKGIAINIVDSAEMSKISQYMDFYKTQIVELPGDISNLVETVQESNREYDLAKH